MSKISKIAYEYREPDPNEYSIRLQAYKALFSLPDGDIVLRDLIQYCKYLDTSVTDSGVLNAHTAGLQAVLKHIEEMLEREESQYNEEE